MTTSRTNGRCRTFESLTSRAGRPKLDEVGSKQFWLLAAAVAAVLFARLLGHQFVAFSWAAWAALVAATMFACRPQERAGIVALVLLSVPALSALIELG